MRLCPAHGQGQVQGQWQVQGQEHEQGQDQDSGTGAGRSGESAVTVAVTVSGTVTIAAEVLGEGFRVDSVLRSSGLLGCLAVRQCIPATHEQCRRAAMGGTAATTLLARSAASLVG